MKKDFYDRVASILGIEHDYNSYNDKIWRRDKVTGELCGTNGGRFAGRQPGNGRFLGIGIVRHYGRAVHIVIKDPPANKLCKSEEEALDFLKDLYQK